MTDDDELPPRMTLRGCMRQTIKGVVINLLFVAMVFALLALLLWVAGL